MPAYKTLGKGVNQVQFEVFEKACLNAGLTHKQAVEVALKLFVESQGLEWPSTGKHGGDRKSEKVRKQD